MSVLSDATSRVINSQRLCNVVTGLSILKWLLLIRCLWLPDVWLRRQSGCVDVVPFGRYRRGHRQSFYCHLCHHLLPHLTLLWKVRFSENVAVSFPHVWSPYPAHRVCFLVTPSRDTRFQRFAIVDRDHLNVAETSVWTEIVILWTELPLLPSTSPSLLDGPTADEFILVFVLRECRVSCGNLKPIAGLLRSLFLSFNEVCFFTTPHNPMMSRREVGQLWVASLHLTIQQWSWQTHVPSL